MISPVLDVTTGSIIMHCIIYLQSVNCFLLDNNGYVMASKTPEKDLGKFFGDVDAQVMTYLVAVHNLFVG